MVTPDVIGKPDFDFNLFEKDVVIEISEEYEVDDITYLYRQIAKYFLSDKDTFRIDIRQTITPKPTREVMEKIETLAKITCKQKELELQKELLEAEKLSVGTWQKSD
jgi:hypothetical protein